MRIALLFFAVAALVTGCPSSTTRVDDASTSSDAGSTADATSLEDAAVVEDAAVGEDAAVVVDAATNVDGATTSACDPIGMYAISWTRAPSNPADCTDPASTVDVTSDDGLDDMVRGICMGAGCSPSTCMVRGATPADCSVAVHVVAPCSGLPTGNGFDVDIVFHDDGTFDTSATVLRPDGSMCSFEGVGTRL